jgi:hypothetical protein
MAMRAMSLVGVPGNVGIWFIAPVGVPAVGET